MPEYFKAGETTRLVFRDSEDKTDWRQIYSDYQLARGRRIYAYPDQPVYIDLGIAK